jgi:hypothetical protein
MEYMGEPGNAMRDVRVTAKVSVGRDFIAPDLSPVSTHIVEMAKGLRGFTDMDKKVVTVVTTPAQEKAKRVMRDVKDMNVGTRVIRHKASSRLHVAPMSGPSAERQAMLDRARMLAEREGYTW